MFRYTRVQLFKTNDIVSKWDVKFSNILYVKTLKFLQNKKKKKLCEAFAVAVQKLFTIFQQKYYRNWFC